MPTRPSEVVFTSLSLLTFFISWICWILGRSEMIHYCTQLGASGQSLGCFAPQYGVSQIYDGNYNMGNNTIYNNNNSTMSNSNVTMSNNGTSSGNMTSNSTSPLSPPSNGNTTNGTYFYLNYAGNGASCQPFNYITFQPADGLSFCPPILNGYDQWVSSTCSDEYGSDTLSCALHGPLDHITCDGYASHQCVNKFEMYIIFAIVLWGEFPFIPGGEPSHHKIFPYLMITFSTLSRYIIAAFVIVPNYIDTTRDALIAATVLLIVLVLWLVIINGRGILQRCGGGWDRLDTLEQWNGFFTFLQAMLVVYGFVFLVVSLYYSDLVDGLSFYYQGGKFNVVDPNPQTDGNGYKYIYLCIWSVLGVAHWAFRMIGHMVNYEKKEAGSLF